MNPEDDLIGVFVGLESASYEYLANIIAPYQSRFAPKLGGFLLVENGDDFIVTRIMEYTPRGELTTFMGEKWLSEVALYPEAIGQDLMRKKVTYRVKIKLLGRLVKNTNEFKPGISVIPHITSPVMYPSREITQQICNQALSDQAAGIHIGDYTLDPSIPINFDVKQLLGRRTFIFARAGYGKSNLMKLLASNWKSTYGALMIFDPEGEYAVTVNDEKPGIMDTIPAISVTNRQQVKKELQDVNVYDKLKFNMKDFSPEFIIPILVTESKHDAVFYNKLMSLDEKQWQSLVDLLYANEWRSSAAEITTILKGEDGDGSKNRKNDQSVQPIINNLVAPIKNLHDPDSQLVQILDQAAQKGLPVILDISLLDEKSALQFASIVVAHFFDQNQKRFTGGEENLNKIVFVMEEAQSVIGGQTNVSKFIELAKEGRKYKLGGIFITQQPSSIAPEILSQGDNFFVFHMLSKGDLRALEAANAHYSADILTQVLNEPVLGKAYMWASRQPFVMPVQILDFDKMVKLHQASQLQAQHRLLDQVQKKVSERDVIYESILTLLLDSATKKFDLKSPEDNRFYQEKGLKGKISMAVHGQLNEEQKKFLKEEDGLALNGQKKSFAIEYQYLEKMWEALKRRNKK